MAFTCFKTTKALTTGDGATVSVTGSPFQPKGALFWVMDTSNSAGGERAVSIGYTDGTNQWGFASIHDDIGTAARGTAFHTNCCVRLRTGDGATGGRYAFSAWTSDGVTLARTNAVQTNVTIHVLFFGGADFTATCGTGTLPTTNATTEVVSGLGHTPNALLYLSGSPAHTAAAGTNSAIGSLGIGFATGASAECGVGGAAVDAAAPANTTMRAFDAAVWGNQSTRTVDFASFEADGFTLNVNGTNTSATNYGWVAITVPNAWAGVTTLQTGTGTWDVTSAGFTPLAGLFAAAPHVTAFATDTDTYHFALGATDGTNQGGSTMLDTDAVTSDPGYDNYTTDLLRGLERTAADTFATESTVDFSSWLSNGVRLDQTDAAPLAGKVAMLLLGDTSSAKRPLWLR